ncbi:MAG TPA: hypothetical protein VK250_00505 [Nitrososphaeraceae archaeon]|nr:hypothetical protein [Nitrososphaeraceae archaeon]
MLNSNSTTWLLNSEYHLFKEKVENYERKMKIPFKTNNRLTLSSSINESTSQDSRRVYSPTRE